MNSTILLCNAVCALMSFGHVTFQERAQCRMMMIQDGQFLNAPEKPLRIMGDVMRAQRGKDLVQDLLTEKELEVSQTGDKNWKVIMGEAGIIYQIKSCYLYSFLQCNDFNRGHPRFFNQSEADLLTKNLDCGFKSQSDSFLNLTWWWEQT